MSENAPENDFERESSRLNEGLKSCRTVMDNYRAMMGGDQSSEQSGSDSGDQTGYVSTTGTTAASYGSDSAAN